MGLPGTARYRGYGYAGPGYVRRPPPPPEPAGPPPPEPPQPGFRWVAVPIGAPAPTAAPPEPAAAAGAAPAAAGPPPDAPPPPGPTQSEWYEAQYGEAPYGEAQYGETPYGEYQPGYGQGEWEAPMQNGHERRRPLGPPERQDRAPGRLSDERRTRPPPGSWSRRRARC